MNNIDFNNTQKAFEYRSNKELQKAKLLFSSLKFPFLVKIGSFSILALNKIGLSPNFILKPFIFNHFCGGTTLDKTQEVANKLGQYQVFSIPDYSVEGKTTNAGIESVIEETIQTMKAVSSNSNLAFSVFKPTALAPSTILEKMNNKSILTSEEQKTATLFHQRFERLCEMAAQYKVKLLIDAEEYCFQDLIDEKCESMMYKYNKNEVIIYNTLQMYRHDRENYLEKLIKRARNDNFKIGLKVVRGAYLEKENDRALKNNYPTPIHASKAETDKSYDNAVRTIVENSDVSELFLGTHNRKSIELLIELMQKKGISPSDKRFFIGQLYGMSDNLTFNLASNQYNVAKYLPYGPVKETIPYLIRRAQENTAVAGETSRELLLIDQEISRRKMVNK